MDRMKCLFYILILLPIIGLSQPFRGSQNSANKNTGSILVHDFSVNEEEEPEPEPQPANYDFLVTSSASGTDNDTLTLAQALDSIPYMTAGDTLAFNKGENFEITETITIPSGVVIISHGTGADPILYGSGTITGWSVYSGNIYSTTFETEIYQLTENDVKQKLARYDNDSEDDEWDNKITSFTDDNTFTADISSEVSNYYQGALCYIRTRDWCVETRTVSSSTGNTLDLSSNPHYKRSTYGEYLGGIYLTNHLNFLDSPGEWYQSGSTLYYQSTDNADPDTHTIRGDILDTMFICGEGVKISGLDIRDIQSIAVYINADYVKIEDCSITNVDSMAIVLGQSADYDSIVGCNISATTASAISGVGNDYFYCGYDTISNNFTLDNFGKKVLPTNSGGTMFIGSGTESDGADYITYEYCQVSDFGSQGMGADGIYIDPGDRSTDYDTIRYNYVFDGAKVVSDVGAIYTYCTHNGIYFYKNIVHDIQGDGSGAANGEGKAYGIYSDQPYAAGFGGVMIEENTSYNNYGGILIHCVYENQDAYNNTVYDCTDGITVSSYYGNTSVDVTYNTVYLKSGNTLIYFYSGGSSNSDYNTFISHYTTDEQFWVHTSWPPDYYNFTEWKSNTGEDANSTLDDSAIGTRTDSLFVNTSAVAVDFTLVGTWRDLNGDAESSPLTLQPFTSKILLKD